MSEDSHRKGDDRNAGSVGEDVPRPNLVGAVMLTLSAFVITLFFYALLLPAAGHWASMAVGVTLGFGVTGTMAARSVPDPAPERIGLRDFPPPFALAVLLLVPAALLASELDNIVHPLLPEIPLPEGDPATPPDDPAQRRLGFVEAGIATVLLLPILEEFFFRGVVQQGLVAIRGAVAGVLLTSLLYAGVEGGLNLPFGPSAALRAMVPAFATGIVLGALRIASRSIAVPILLRIAIASLGLASVAFEEAPQIPGFNAPGDHTPAGVLALAALCVTAGLALTHHLGQDRT